MNPEHLHVAINHVPLIGMSCAFLPLMIGLIGQRRESLIIGLLLAALCGASIPLVMWSGERAEDDWLTSEAAAHLDEDAQAWAHVHEERAEQGAKVIYATAGLAVLGLLSFLRKSWRKAAWVLGGLTALGCIGCVAVSVWVSDAGGQINHPEFRKGPPPVSIHTGSYVAPSA